MNNLQQYLQISPWQSHWVCQIYLERLRLKTQSNKYKSSILVFLKLLSEFIVQVHVKHIQKKHLYGWRGLYIIYIILYIVYIIYIYFNIKILI